MKYLMGKSMADMRAITDDELLAEAERIKARRLQAKRLESFEKQTDVMIR